MWFVRFATVDKNPYSTRGLGKFWELLTELDERRKKVYSKMNPHDISFVQFAYSDNDEVSIFLCSGCYDIDFGVLNGVCSKPIKKTVRNTNEKEYVRGLSEKKMVVMNEGLNSPSNYFLHFGILGAVL
ncbi:uncharacterized protein LOC107492285 [Arachis duranensis]|uniref:Uncharacterized protein LOC107492285 n=1 Tax=Arachis duranensis TaxID=130453 RepID=A0A6P4DLK2_ARADU|nr:uncharacterized protein LOC107492285 [Arachis duranensis]